MKHDVMTTPEPELGYYADHHHNQLLIFGLS